MDERLCWINLIFVPIRGSQKSGSGKQQDIVRHRRQIPPDARIPVSPQMLVEHLMQRGKSATASTRHSTPASRHKRIRFLRFAFAFSTGCAEYCGISCLFCVFPRTSSSSETPNSSLSRIMLSKSGLAVPSSHLEMDWRDTCSRSASSCWDRFACRRNACSLAPSSFI